MVKYKLTFKPTVEKDLRSLPSKVVSRVMLWIERLKEDPLPRQAIKLTGAEKLYRLRVGDYRIIYEFDIKAEQLIIHYIRHRREVYRK